MIDFFEERVVESARPIFSSPRANLLRFFFAFAPFPYFLFTTKEATTHAALRFCSFHDFIFFLRKATAEDDDDDDNDMKEEEKKRRETRRRAPLFSPLSPLSFSHPPPPVSQTLPPFPKDYCAVMRAFSSINKLDFWRQKKGGKRSNPPPPSP